MAFPSRQTNSCSLRLLAIIALFLARCTTKELYQFFWPWLKVQNVTSSFLGIQIRTKVTSNTKKRIFTPFWYQNCKNCKVLLKYFRLSIWKGFLPLCIRHLWCYTKIKQTKIAFTKIYLSLQSRASVQR